MLSLLCNGEKSETGAVLMGNIRDRQRKPLCQGMCQPEASVLTESASSSLRRGCAQPPSGFFW